MIAPLELETPYNSKFFDDLAVGSFRSARAVVPLVLELTEARSVVDVGCGTGAWLHVFAEQGVTDYLGIDGDYVDRSQLHIPEPRFRSVDLSAPSPLERQFDLAVCLEVAEHLPATVAPKLIELLTGAAPFVLFSAAIPGQNGTDHRNEQWPWYWRELFERHHFVPVDSISAQIWSRSDVEFWYRQNITLYVNSSDVNHHGNLADKFDTNDDDRMMLIHESILRRHVDAPIGRMVEKLGAAIGRSLKRRWVRLRASESANTH
jgi:SAM-dependent methyltransferase